MDDFCGFDILGAYSSAPSLDDVRAGRRVIGRDMQGDSVMYVQGLAGAIADGKFGPATETAVRSFQRAHGLGDSGIVDAGTMAELDKLAQGGTAGVEKISFVPGAAAIAPRAAAAPSAPAAMHPLTQSWWTQPAWLGGWERWKVAAAAGGGTVGLFALLAWLLSGGKVAPVKR